MLVKPKRLLSGRCFKDDFVRDGRQTAVRRKKALLDKECFDCGMKFVPTRVAKVA
ncbi:hypothetical protein IKF12_02585 [Candidatus Saccharibacteria bacterium]|nr:hypothetical protein [Candidatus Saccharibacteria bacterium]